MFNAATTGAARPAPTPRRAAAAIFPNSYKHYRAVIGADSVKIAYYGHDGRKVTARRYPLSQYYAMTASAKARGYRPL